jgi:hypothetical protein
MSFCRTITTYNSKSVQQKAKMANERRRQSQAWLRRQEEQKKPARHIAPLPRLLTVPILLREVGRRALPARNKFCRFRTWRKNDDGSARMRDLFAPKVSGHHYLAPVEDEFKWIVGVFSGDGATQVIQRAHKHDLKTFYPIPKKS